MARAPQLRSFCLHHGLKMISVADLIRYRMKHERIIQRAAEGVLRTDLGEFRIYSYRSSIDPETHVALVYGQPSERDVALVRMHARCTFGDVFGSTECDCHAILRTALERIVKEGAGVLVYLHQSGSGMRQGEPETEGGLARLVSHSREHMHYASPAGQRLLQHETGIGAQIISAPNSPVAADPNAVLKPVGPTDTTLPPVEKPAEAPTQVNDIKSGQTPAQSTAANSKKKPKADLSEDSSSKKKKKKGIAKLNPF